MINKEVEVTNATLRHDLRLSLFSAVRRKAPLAPVLEMYTVATAALVPPSITEWALRTERSPAEEAARFVQTIYQKDLGIAQQFKTGVEINGRMVHLPGLINRERKARRRDLGIKP